MSHEKPVQSNEWYTPAYVFEALGVVFDTDVASPLLDNHSKVPADNKLTILDDGINSPWLGFVWMNPPFENKKIKMQWIERFISHKNGIALLPDRTSSNWWQYLAENADGLLFVKGRIKFIKPDGKRGANPANGTTLFAIGEKGIEALKTADLLGLGKYYENK